jgi:hypothetical protein
MPTSDGFHILQSLLRGQDPPFVLLTSADPGAASDELARHLGAVGFLPKTMLAETDLREYFGI